MTPRRSLSGRVVALALAVTLGGCALLRSPNSQTTTTSSDGARVVVVVFALWAPHVVGIDLSGPVSGATGGQSAEQSTKVDAKASGLPGLP